MAQQHPQQDSGFKLPRWPWERKPVPEQPKNNEDSIEEIKQELHQLDHRIQLLENRFTILERE
jgi:hypothetical protein